MRVHPHSDDRQLQYIVAHRMCLLFYFQELRYPYNDIRHDSVKSNEILKMHKEELNRKTIEWNKFKDTKRVIRSGKLKDKQYNGHQKVNNRTNIDLQNTT